MAELTKYLNLMLPLKDLFSAMNADHVSTIHLVYPSLRNLDKHLEVYLKDDTNPLHSYAKV